MYYPENILKFKLFKQNSTHPYPNIKKIITNKPIKNGKVNWQQFHHLGLYILGMQCLTRTLQRGWSESWWMKDRDIDKRQSCVSFRMYLILVFPWGLLRTPMTHLVFGKSNSCTIVWINLFQLFYFNKRI